MRSFVYSSSSRLRFGILTLLVASIGLASCQPAKQEPAKAASQPNAVANLDLNAADVLTAQTTELMHSIPISGSLQAANSAVVKAKIASELTRLTVREGDPVKAGQLIGELDAREARLKLTQAHEQASSARAQLEIAERTLNNNKALVNQGFISKNALETSVSNATGAQATLQAAQAAAHLAQKALDDTVLRAPINGFVARRYAQVGERVNVDARILEIVDLSRIELQAPLPPQEIAGIRIGVPAQLAIDGLPEPLTAHIARINPTTEAGSRAIVVYLALPAHPALRHGLFATGQIELEKKQVLAVPETVIHTDQAQPYVLALERTNQPQIWKIVEQRVQLGMRGQIGKELWVEIQQGLQPGTAILGPNIGLIRDGTLARLTPAPAAASTSH